MPRRDAILSERLDSGSTRGELCVFPVKAGGYAAEYMLGRAKLPVPVVGLDAVAVMASAKKWLKTPMGTH